MSSFIDAAEPPRIVVVTEYSRWPEQPQPGVPGQSGRVWLGSEAGDADIGMSGGFGVLLKMEDHAGRQPPLAVPHPNEPQAIGGHLADVLALGHNGNSNVQLRTEVAWHEQEYIKSLVAAVGGIVAVAGR